MNLSEDVKSYLDARKKLTIDFINGLALPDEIDAKKVDFAISLGLVQPPQLNLGGRSVKHVLEAPDYSLIINMPMQRGGAFNGVSATIPVEGAWELFLAFLGKRWVCNGFKTGNGGIVITQYDFNGNELDVVKNGIKTCVDSLQIDLESFALQVTQYNASLRKEAAAAGEARKAGILASWKKNKDADPWG